MPNGPTEEKMPNEPTEEKMPNEPYLQNYTISYLFSI